MKRYNNRQEKGEDSEDLGIGQKMILKWTLQQ